MSENNQFYYENNGANMGPVSSDEIIELAKKGTLNRNSLIWRQGYEDWKKLSESEIDVSFLPPPMKQYPSSIPPSLNRNKQIAFSVNMSNDNVFMKYYVNNLKNYINFKGRARRKEFWFFMLFSILISILLSVIENVIGAVYLMRSGYSYISIGILSTLYSLAIFIPSVGLYLRRIQDTGRTPLWLLLVFIPLLGWIPLIVFLCMDSQAGENRYGANPKEQDLA